jgi:ectoine hydroxylase-related dioxygenase (phytanoyl-CoA dioxygenase family)
MQLHTDQLAITPPTRVIAYGMNIMFYLEDITHENGATRVHPGSHLGNIAPNNIFTVVSPLQFSTTVCHA